ncbi:hypothetical protein AAKU67_002156 [Oxalobacteraceae bacterium GrIS 2.11]
MNQDLHTPYECGNRNQTATWEECISFYQLLAGRYPTVLRFFEIGRSDGGTPIHAGVVTADGVFDQEQIRRANRPVFFNNNGIHPGEPEGIDACMALVRDFCIDPVLRAALKDVVFLFIPIYNVDGCLNRNSSSRVNQLGPENHGFRGNALNLDLNRDFIKCDSLNAQVFNQFFAGWDPDLMVDTHTSNGADYSYTMTVIQTQADKLGGALGAFVRDILLPEVSVTMQGRGWPFCPYVNPVKETPDDGIEDFLEVPRFSTGYAALNHTIGFMPETHMLKSFADRYESMRAFVETMVKFTAKHASEIQALRKAARSAMPQSWPLTWNVDRENISTFRFNGFAAVYSPSKLGNYQRLSYDRNQPWEKDIDYYDHFVPDISVPAAKSYIVPQQWREVIQRLAWNQVAMERVAETTLQSVQTYHVSNVTTRSAPYEGHMFHDGVEVESRTEIVRVNAGDYLIHTDQVKSRYVVETLEPQAHDSFFRWGFFNSILEKKETFSDYVFEDTALELLETEPGLRSLFEQWGRDNPELLSDQQAVLQFIFAHCQRYREPEWRRYPVFRVV